MAAENSGKKKGITAVTTFCEVLDILLGGDGVKLGHITEIVGTPGAGKTQLCLQLCASLQIFSELGGLNAEALYIDTGTNFSLSRLRGVFNGTVSRVQPYLKKSIKINEAEALKRVHRVKAISMERYCSLLYTLPHYIKAHPNTKLIVIDSMAQPLKPSHSKLTSKQSAGVLFRHMADLQKIAEQNQIAVVLTNELTTRLDLTKDSWIYALDDAWSHRFNARLLLSKPFCERDSFRLVVRMKDDANVLQFQSTPEGVRDVSELDTSQAYAFVMWNEHCMKKKGITAVTTFCEVLDILLGGDGVKLGHITEIVGTPGAGKTQLCLQLCASLQIFSELGGLNAEALYIDTGTNFSLSRLRGVFNGTVSRVQPYLKKSIKINEAEALKRVHRVKAISMERYCSLLYTLPHYIKAHPNTKLIVIDSMAQPLKPSHSKLTSKQSAGVLFRHMADLQKIAEQNQIAVVLTNELTTRLDLTKDSWIYALDDAWSHRFNARLLLSKPFCERDSFRLVVRMKDDANVLQFQSTPEGVRDVSELDTSQAYAFVMWNEHCMVLCSNTGLEIHMFYTLGL